MNSLPAFLIATLLAQKPAPDSVGAEPAAIDRRGAGTPRAVKLLAGSALPYTVQNDVISVQLPAGTRSNLVDVVAIDLR